VQKFHWHVSPTCKSGAPFLVFAPLHGRPLGQSGEHRHRCRATAPLTPKYIENK
jgi:hypothetical protein